MSSSHTTNASAVVQEEVFKLEEQVAGMHLTVKGKELQCKESYFREVYASLVLQCTVSGRQYKHKTDIEA